MDWQAAGVISNAILILALVGITYYYATQTRTQANAMEAQNRLINDGMRLDRLAKRYERLEKEMGKLVGPLYSRRTDMDIFGHYTAAKRDVLQRKGYGEFWEGIKEYKYLATPELSTALDNFINLIDIGIQSASSPAEAEKMLADHREMLFAPLKRRYEALNEQIRNLESEMGWTPQG